MLKPVTAIYIRTSTNKQDTGAEAQQRAIEKYCERQGITEFKLYIDKDQSGKKRNRPEFDKLKRDIKKKEIKSVVTYSLTRIGRSTRHLLEISDFFQDHDIGFASVTENFDTTTPSGRLFFTMLSAIAQFEREVISERVKSGMANAKEKGKKIGRKKERNSELIIALHESGKSIREIAVKAKCSKGSVEAELKAYKKNLSL